MTPSFEGAVRERLSFLDTPLKLGREWGFALIRTPPEGH